MSISKNEMKRKERAKEAPSGDVSEPLCGLVLSLRKVKSSEQTLSFIKEGSQTNSAKRDLQGA